MGSSACIRCGGFVVLEYPDTRYEQVRCVPCGWYYIEPYKETPTPKKRRPRPWHRFLDAAVLATITLLVCPVAEALEPSSVEAISPLWTGRDLGRGKTIYSQGLNTTTELTPTGPSSYFQDTWSPDRMNTVGTIYSPPTSSRTMPAPPILPTPQNSRSVRQP